MMIQPHALKNNDEQTERTKDWICNPYLLLCGLQIRWNRQISVFSMSPCLN